MPQDGREISPDRHYGPPGALAYGRPGPFMSLPKNNSDELKNRVFPIDNRPELCRDGFNRICTFPRVCLFHHPELTRANGDDRRG